MSTQQDIYADGSENRPPMLNKENYVPWSSRLLRYAKSRPNGKLIYNFIMNGPYVRRMIPELGDPAHTVPVPKTFHEQTDDELTEAKIKQMEADDQAIQTILLGLPKDIYAAVDSCETAQEIWLHVQQMMKGSDIRIQEKKAKLFNKWERFTSTDGESIESYYHHFSKLMNDFKRNKHFPKKISTDYTQLYDFLKYNQKEVDELRAERLAKSQDPLALMANSNNSFNYPVFCPDLPSSSTYIQQPLPNNNNYNPQPSFNQNYMQQPMPNLKDITDPTTAMNMALALMAKAFKPNYSTPTNNNQRISSNPRNRQIAQPSMNLGQDNQMQMVRGNGGISLDTHQNRNGNVVAARAEGNANGNNEAGIQLQAKEFDLMDAAVDLDKIEEVNANCILMANLQQASTSGTQTNKAPVYDSDGSAEVQLHDYCYNDEIFNMFTQEEQYTELLEPIPEPHQVPQKDSNVIYEVSIVEQGGGIVEQHPANVEETRVLYDSLYNSLATEVEKVNSVNCKLRETNANLTTKLARYKNQERCFEISQEKYDKLERCYQQSVYQEQCLSKRIITLHLSSGKQITALNEEISNLNKQLSKKKSTVSSLQEKKKRLKSDFKIREDELLDKKNQLENKVKEIDNILVKMGQSIQRMHMLSPKPDSFYHTEQKMTLGYQNPFYLKQAQQKQQSLYNGKVLLEKHDPPTVYDSEETLELAQETDESLAKHKALELEIERLLRAVVSQDIMSIMQNNSMVDTSNFQTELDRTKERLENYTLDPLFQKLENEKVELEFQIRNYEKENAYLKAVYKNLFDSINVTRTQTKTIIDYLQNKLHDMIYENTKLRAQLFDKVSEQKDTTRGTNANTKFAKQSILGIPPSSRPKLYDVNPLPKSMTIPKVGETNALIDPRNTSREDKFVPIHNVRAIDVTTKTRRPQPKSNTKNDRVPSASQSSCIKNTEVKVEEHHRNLLLSNNPKHMSSECNNIKLSIRNDKSEVVYAMYKKCLITTNHYVCMLNYVNGMKPRGKKQKEKVSNIANQTKHKPHVWKLENVGPKERLASPKPSKPRMCLRWSPTGKMFDFKGKLITSSESNGDKACYPNMFMVCRLGLFQAYDGNLKLIINFVWKFLGTVRFGNDHVAAILGFRDL
ncbi:hypothetical protein Tco_1039924 [Tanacetum coccineum]